jgi:hypothetical protein
MALTRTRKTFFLLVVSLLITPWVHSFIKPYRLRVEMPYFHAVSTPIFVYHSNQRNQPTAFTHEQVDALHIVHTREMPAPMALTRTVVRSKRPITGLRIDPAVMPNEIRIGSIALSTYTATHILTAAELEPHVRAGIQIDNVRLDGDFLVFNTTGGDPNFLVPLPEDILRVPRSLVVGYYLLSWGVGLAMVLFVALLARRHRILPTGRWRRPLAVDGPVSTAWGGIALDLGATVLLVLTLLQFVHLYTSFDITPLARSLDRDGVGEAVPREVRDMKALVLRHGHPSYVLAGDMGKGDDESEIFQRATEYLYPARVVHQSRWVFARAGKPPAATFGRCVALDRENLIELYDCQP